MHVIHVIPCSIKQFGKLASCCCKCARKSKKRRSNFSECSCTNGFRFVINAMDVHSNTGIKVERKVSTNRRQCGVLTMNYKDSIQLLFSERHLLPFKFQGWIVNLIELKFNNYKNIYWLYVLVFRDVPLWMSNRWLTDTFDFFCLSEWFQSDGRTDMFDGVRMNSPSENLSSEIRSDKSVRSSESVKRTVGFARIVRPTAIY